MRPTDSQAATILVVDDDAVTRRTLTDVLAPAGYAVVTAASATDARRLAADAEPALAILDLVLPDGDGIELLGSLRASWPAMPAIIVTGYVEPRSIVEAMRRGAVDYLAKPVDPEVLLSACRAALARRPAPVRAEAAAEPLTIVGGSPATSRLRESIQRLAGARPAGVLLIGENGTGKTWLAQALHGVSGRRQAPCVVYACADAYVPSVALFGPRGVTGAGLLAAAAGGTLILDDVDGLPAEVQAELLAWVDSRQRTGGPLLIGLVTSDTALGSPLIAWLSRARIDVAPLRERVGDVLPLARHFLAAAGAARNRRFVGLAVEAENRLLAHSWPGNVGELREVIERVTDAMAGGTIQPEHLALASSTTVPAWVPAGPPRPLREIEEAYIDHVIAVSGGNKTRAAHLLGIARETLRSRLLARGHADPSAPETSGGQMANGRRG